MPTHPSQTHGAFSISTRRFCVSSINSSPAATSPGSCVKAPFSPPSQKRVPTHPLFCLALITAVLYCSPTGLADVFLEFVSPLSLLLDHACRISHRSTRHLCLAFSPIITTLHTPVYTAHRPTTTVIYILTFIEHSPHNLNHSSSATTS
jgi:hypothetical protein